MRLEEVNGVFFILDGGPAPNGICDLSTCFEPSAGTYLVLECDTDEELGTAQLCLAHAKEYATI
jgi:hypothetical protein